MKEERHYLDTLQTIFLEKVMHKIAQGKWDDFGSNTLEGLSSIIQLQYYTNSQKAWLMGMRKEYINTFCK